MVGQKQKDGPNILNMFMAVIVFAALAIYGTVALAAQDGIWFLKGFYTLPDRITVYHAGQKTELNQGDEGYLELAEAVRASLDAGVARQSGIGMSELTLQEAYTKYVTVEAFFFTPVKLHAWFNTHQPTQMLFPITGRHSELGVVMLGMGGKYLSNGPALKDMSPLRTALKVLGYLDE